MDHEKQPDRITILNARFQGLRVDQFTAQPGQAWCILGLNRSGIDRFFRLLCQNPADIDARQMVLPPNMGSVSFKDQQDIYEAELKKDDTDFMDKIDPGTLAKEFIHDMDSHWELIEALDMAGSLSKGYRQLSTGQSRKLMLLSRISKGLACLAVQCPYDGLDARTGKELDRAMEKLFRQGILIIVFVNNTGDVPSWCTHIGLVEDQRLKHQGKRDPMMAVLEDQFSQASPDFKARVEDVSGTREGEPEDNGRELVRLKNGRAGYQGEPVFKGLNLSIHEGGHTLVTGPNGCGKSTLLQVVTGDHPACYSNDLRIFGIQRGTGESIWELKAHMGIVSSDLHRNYLVPGNTLHCIISGLFDSIGLYQPYSPDDEQKALTWLDRLGLSHKALTPFRDLTYARQRLVLIARALIKMPRLLVLDEPTQGLDELNRKAVLDFLEGIAREKLSTILYVSHREDEFRPFFVQRLDMGRGSR